jgi:hypothetical protein
MNQYLIQFIFLALVIPYLTTAIGLLCCCIHELHQMYKPQTILPRLPRLPLSYRLRHPFTWRKTERAILKLMPPPELTTFDIGQKVTGVTLKVTGVSLLSAGSGYTNSPTSPPP